MCVCVCACVRACMRACVHVCTFMHVNNDFNSLVKAMPVSISLTFEIRNSKQDDIIKFYHW